VKRKRASAPARPPRPPVIRAFLGDEAVADNFAGGGGASLGIELALGRSPDVAVNHDPEAIAMHQANHPSTRHFVESVWEVDPREACGGRPVALAWFSPDCKHHSKAKGGKPRDQKIRGLAWVAVTWAARVKPRVIALENVEEFQDWGPLHRSGPSSGKPIKSRKGQTFRAFVRRLELLGYRVEWRLLRACDYGAPTTRRRLFLVARRDGQAIRWPAPTHGKAGELLGLQPYRTAAECIDWSIPCPSIFDRERPLADKTLARIARGVRKFVLDAARPFVIPVNHGGPGRVDHRVHDVDAPMPTITGGQRGGHALVAPVLTRTGQTGGRGGYVNDVREPVTTIVTKAEHLLVSPMLVKAKTHGGGGNEPMSADEPLRTVTASKRGEFAIAVPYLVHRSNGERPGQEPRIYDPARPLGTIVAQGQKHALCTAFLAKHFGGNESAAGGTAADAPMATVTARDHHSAVKVDLVASHLVKFAGTSEAHLDASAHGLDEPIPTVTAGGWKMAQVAAFLVRYNGTGDAEAVNGPIGALTAKPRFGLVTVTIDGEEYVVADIGMRMLEPRELFRAQGFHDDYEIAPVGPNGKRLSKTAQIRMCGNSVSPPVAAAIVRANLGSGADQRRAA
jgi:DNA (cytosine-5)-methyltransferase 1